MSNINILLKYMHIYFIKECMYANICRDSLWFNNLHAYKPHEIALFSSSTKNLLEP